MFRRAKVLFDSASVGRSIGMRSFSRGERSLLFATETLSIDVLVCTLEDGLQVYHGQVIDAERKCPVDGACVSLGTEYVETDRYGQFNVSGLATADSTVLFVQTTAMSVACAVPTLESPDGGDA